MKKIPCISMQRVIYVKCCTGFIIFKKNSYFRSQKPIFSKFILLITLHDSLQEYDKIDIHYLR